jgi:hypothetical protein
MPCLDDVTVGFAGGGVGVCERSTLLGNIFVIDRENPFNTLATSMVTAFIFVYGGHSKTRLNVLEARMCANL